jgi:4-aminobutyrate aminotransferase/(S)-3-amino-2-methylpropionate transaminase
LAEKYDEVGDVRGRGAMQAIELVAGDGSLTPNPALTAAVSSACHREGLITLTAGTYGNVLRFLPPLVIGDDLLHEGLDLLETAFAAAVHGHPSAQPPWPEPAEDADQQDGADTD